MHRHYMLQAALKRWVSVETLPLEKVDVHLKLKFLTNNISHLRLVLILL